MQNYSFALQNKAALKMIDDRRWLAGSFVRMVFLPGMGFPHEPRSECRENIGKFIVRENRREDAGVKILKKNPRRMYGVAH